MPPVISKGCPASWQLLPYHPNAHVLEDEHFILVVRQDALPAGRVAQKLVQVQVGCAGLLQLTSQCQGDVSTDT